MNRQGAANPSDMPPTPKTTHSPSVIHTRYEGISRSFLPFLSPGRLVRNLWGNRALLRQLSKTRFAAGHREDILGMAWLVLEPLVMLAVYSFVFIFIFGVRWEGVPGKQLGTALTLYAGIVTYQIFAQSLAHAAGVIRDSPSYVKQMVFPTEVLPASVVGGMFVPTCIGYTLIIVGTLVGQLLGIGLRVPVTALLLPVVLIPMYLMIVGFAWLVSALCVFIPDVRTITGLIIHFAFFLTPIVYPFHSQRISDQLRSLLLLNPMTTIVESVRAVLIYGRTPPWLALAIVTVASALICQLGFAFFMRSKKAFADAV